MKSSGIHVHLGTTWTGGPAVNQLVFISAVQWESREVGACGLEAERCWHICVSARHGGGNYVLDKKKVMETVPSP